MLNGFSCQKILKMICRTLVNLFPASVHARVRLHASDPPQNPQWWEPHAQSCPFFIRYLEKDFMYIHRYAFSSSLCPVGWQISTTTYNNDGHHRSLLMAILPHKVKLYIKWWLQCAPCNVFYSNGFYDSESYMQ